MVDLPVEVWTYIGFFSSREDLVQLALVSKRHLSLARAILAEEVTIRSRKQKDLDHAKNLRFLVDTQLSKNIKSFRIVGFIRNGAPDIPFAAMPNLQTLVIDNCEAFSANKQKQMVTTLQESCKGLRTVKVSSILTFSHKKFSLSNVATVEWNEAGHLTPALFSLCQASLSTITSLKITVDAPAWAKAENHHEGIKTYKRFFRLRFPSLSSLNMGFGHSSLTPFGEDETGGAFTKFLRGHPTLEKLVLPQLSLGSGRDDVYLPIDARSLVGSSTLPVLRYFEAHPRLIAELLEKKAHFLITNVETLCINEADHPDHWTPPIFTLEDDVIDCGEEEMPLISILYRLGESRKTLALKHLVIHLSKINDDDEALEFIKESLIFAAKSFPNLESWVGSIPVVSDDFVELFSQFPRLRTISGILGLSKPIEENSVLKIATTCKHLERVDCLETAKSFVIDRLAGGKPHINVRRRLPDFDEHSPELEFMMHDAEYHVFNDGGFWGGESDDRSLDSLDGDSDEWSG